MLNEVELAEVQGFGGSDWVKMRQNSFIRKRRTPTNEAPLTPLEYKLRQFETRVAMELCCRSNVSEGVDRLAIRAPELAQVAKVHEVKGMYRSARIYPRPRTYLWSSQRKLRSLLIADLRVMTVDDVCLFLRSEGFVDLEPLARKHHVNGLKLITLTRKEMKEELGIVKQAHRERLSRVITLLVKHTEAKCGTDYNGPINEIYSDR